MKTAEQIKVGQVLRVAMCVFMPFAFAYLLTSVMRTVNAVQGPQLMSSLHISLPHIGLLSACFLLGYGLSQPFLGMVLDRYGPKRTQVVLLIFASMFTVMFATAHGIGALIVSRTLIGLGLAGGLTAALTANATWFRSERLALLNTLTLMVGSIGVIFGTIPLHRLLTVFNWRVVNWGLVWMMLAAAVVILVLVPRRQRDEKAIEQANFFVGLGVILKNREFWRLVPLFAVSLGFLLALQGLWAGTWLHDVKGLTDAGVAHLLMIFTIATICGLLATGLASYLANRWNISLTKVLIVGFIYTLIFELMLIEAKQLNHYLLWFCYGFFVQFLTLAFTILANNFKREFVGRAMSFTVFILYLTAFAIQYLVGVILDFWPAGPRGDHPLISYRVAFGIFVGLQVVALIWFWVGKKLPERSLELG